MNQSIRGMSLAIMALTSPAAVAELHKGENLLQPFPLPEGQWIAAQSKQGRNELVDWVKPDTKDNVRTAVLRGQGGYSTDRFREINYQGGRESCKTFEGKVLDDTPVNGFSRSIWLGSCMHADGSASAALWLFISGNDSSYFVYRRWPGTPDEEAVTRWLTYLRSVSVCDTRARRDAPCPK